MFDVVRPFFQKLDVLEVVRLTQRTLVKLFEMQPGKIPVGGADFLQALLLGIDDFEDAVQTIAALQIGADYLVTRNGRDFNGEFVEIRTPGELVALL